MSDQHEQVMQVLREEYSRLDTSGEIGVRPAQVASRAQARLDSSCSTPILVAYCSTMQLRQMARSVCRASSAVDDPSVQGALFDGQLQRRYPAQRNGDEEYVLREHMTVEERRANSARLRAEAASKNRHADALDAETDALVAAGHFDQVAA